MLERTVRGAYEAARERALRELSAMIFGDLYLEDARRYREETLRPLGIERCFRSGETKRLSEQMTDVDLHAIVTCLYPRKVPRELAGKSFDRNFLAALPPGADPCAERGEFHTVAIVGPMFSHPIPISIGRRWNATASYSRM